MLTHKSIDRYIQPDLETQVPHTDSENNKIRFKMRTSTAFIAACVISSSQAFQLVPSLPASAQYTTQSTIRTSLSAVKKKNSKAKKSVAKSNGAGFGAAPTQSATISSGITGTSGSGTKPLRKAANNYDRIRKDFAEEYGLQSCWRDVYVRSPLNSETTFWYVGKIAREPQTADDNDDDTEKVDDVVFFNHAALAQKRLILDYSKDQLRPQNFGGKYASALEVWIAPGDSEMDVATNKASLIKVSGSAKDLPVSWDANAVGYNPEIYIGDEVTKGGLRVERDENGNPTKEAFDVNQSM